MIGGGSPEGSSRNPYWETIGPSEAATRRPSASPDYDSPERHFSLERYFRLGPEIPAEEKTDSEVSALNELGPGIPAEEKPELVEASHVDLKTADLTHGVPRVEKATLGPTVREVVIDGALCGQLGNENKQFNEYRYELKSPQVSVDRIFEGHPEREKAFERLADNPKSKSANRAFCKLLSDDPTYLGGEVKIADACRLGTVRVSIDADGRGPVALDADHVKGWQVGDGGRQYNQYKCTLEGAELNVEAVVRRNPELASALAQVARNPDNVALRRSFTDKLNDACRSRGWQNADVVTGHIDAARISVRGIACQLGSDNISVDKYRLDPEKKMTPVGWEQLPESPELKAASLELERRLAQEQADRIAQSRPVGFVAPEPSPPPPDLLETILERAAVTVLNQVAPGRQHLVKRMTEDAKRALHQTEEFAQGDGDERQASRDDGYRAPWPWAKRTRNGTWPVQAETNGWLPGTSAFSGHGRESGGQSVLDHPYLEFVSSADRMHMMHQQGEDGSANTLPAGPPPAGPPAAPVEPPAAEKQAEAAGKCGNTVFVAGAVVCGSAADVGAATGTDVPDDAESLSESDLVLSEAAALLRYVRRRVFEEKHGGQFQLVIKARRAVEALQVVLFLDPYAGRGLWIDVDPARQAPAAVLPIKLDWSAGLPGHFRFFRL